jgi:hypothetical protein
MADDPSRDFCLIALRLIFAEQSICNKTETSRHPYKSDKRLMLTTLATAAITVVVVNDFTGKHTDKKEIKFSSCIRKFRRDQVQSHIWLTASTYMV